MKATDYALAISAFSAAATFIAAHAIGLFGATPAHADPAERPGVLLRGTRTSTYRVMTLRTTLPSV